MSKKVTLSPTEAEELYATRKFANLPEAIKALLFEEHIAVNQSAAVIKSLKSKKWLILDQTKQFLEVIAISEIEANLNDLTYEVSQETPTHSDNVDDYPIYRIGIPFENDERLYIFGTERKSLKGKELHKWDYFFNQTRDQIGQKHRILIGELKIWEDEFQSKANSLLIKAILIISLFILIIIKIWPIIAFFSVILTLYKFRGLFNLLYYHNYNLKKIQQSISKLQQEQLFLEKKLGQFQVSGKQMEAWLDEEIKVLDEKMIQELGIPKDKLIKRKLIVGERETNGFCIEEWGFFQPLSTNGKKRIENDFEYHLRAYRSNNGKPLVGVYYIYFIYLTEETLGVSGFFYDFILSKRFGQITNQYYYRDIVSIGTKIEDTIILSNKREMETKKVVFSFYNSELISITLTDTIAIDNLREKIELKGSLESISKSINSQIDISDNEEIQELFDLASERLPATRSNIILTNVQVYWNEKKQFGASDSGSIGI